MTLSLRLRSALVTLFLVGYATQSHAWTIGPVADGYEGGYGETGEATPANDVIGPESTYQISSMTVSRAVGSNNLVVTIATNYSGGNVGNDGTFAGDLFLGVPGNLTLNGAVTGFNGDIYWNGASGDADRFSNVLDFTNYTNGVGNTSGTYADIAAGSAVQYANPGTEVQNGTNGQARLYDITGPADVVTTSYPGTPNNRNFQPFDVVTTGKTPGLAGTWSTTAGSFVFTINDFFLSLGSATGIYKTGVTLAWAMSCGNDVIMNTFAWAPGGAEPVVPLPAGIILFFSGLIGLGALGRLKSKISSAAA